MKVPDGEYVVSFDPVDHWISLYRDKRKTKISRYEDLFQQNAQQVDKISKPGSTIYTEKDETGWKMHLSVDDTIPGNLETAWACVIDALRAHPIPQLKVKANIANNFLDQPLEVGRQITAYLGETKLLGNQFYKFGQNLKAFLTRLNANLQNFNVQPSCLPAGDKAFGDSPHLSIRNDKYYDAEKQCYGYFSTSEYVRKGNSIKSIPYLHPEQGPDVKNQEVDMLTPLAAVMQQEGVNLKGKFEHQSFEEYIQRTEVIRSQTFKRQSERGLSPPPKLSPSASATEDFLPPPLMTTKARTSGFSPVPDIKTSTFNTGKKLFVPPSLGESNDEYTHETSDQHQPPTLSTDVESLQEQEHPTNALRHRKYFVAESERRYISHTSPKHTATPTSDASHTQTTTLTSQQPGQQATTTHSDQSRNIPRQKQTDQDNEEPQAGCCTRFLNIFRR